MKKWYDCTYFFPISSYTETSSADFQLIHTNPLTALLPLTSNHRGPLSRSDWSTAWKTFTTSSFSSFTAYKAIKARPSTLQNNSFTTVVNRNWDACNPSPCCRTWSTMSHAQHAEMAASSPQMWSQKPQQCISQSYYSTTEIQVLRWLRNSYRPFNRATTRTLVHQLIHMKSSWGVLSGEISHHKD